MANLLRLIKTYDTFRKEAATPTPEQKHDEGEGQPDPVEPARAEQPPPAAVAPPSVAPPVEAPSPTPVAPPAAPPDTAPTPAVPASRPDTAQENAAALTLYDSALIGVSRMFEAAVTEDITPGRLLACIEALGELCEPVVQSVAADRSLLRKAMGTYAEGEGFMLPHSVNVAVLAVELGKELGLEHRNLLDLCLAGFVHEIGSVRLPHELLTKSESLTPSEWEQMRARPDYAYETIAALGEQYAAVAEIAHQVYERLDGSGYPRGLQGDEILPEARILGTVDFFESFAHPRPYKTAAPGTANRGIRMLMPMADKFGSSTLKALVGSIGLFPIGSYVRLSSGEIGRVVDVKKENPMRPEVEVLLDSERRSPEEPRTLDLLSIPHIYVSRALTASDLRELGLLPPPSGMPTVAPNPGPS